MVNVRQFDVDVLLNFKSNSNNLKDFNKVVSKDMVTNAKAITSSTIDATGYLKRYNQEQVAGLSLLKQKRLLYLDLNKAQKQEVKLNKRMDYGFLSQIFGGMALQRTFGGMFKGIINGYRESSDKNSEFNIGVNKLSGAFNYLKFSIGKAFAENPLVNKVINVLVDGINWLSDVMTDNEWLADSIIVLVGALYTFGTITFGVGTFKSISNGIRELVKDFNKLKNIDIEGIEKSITNFEDNIKIPTGKQLTIIGSALLFSISTWDIITKDGNSILERAVNIGSAAVLGATIGSIIPGLGTLAGGVIGVSVGLVLNIVDILFESGAQEEYIDAQTAIQKKINEEFKKGSYIDTETFTNLISDEIEGIDNDKLYTSLVKAYNSIISQAQNEILTESETRNLLSAIFGVRDKIGDDSAIDLSDYITLDDAKILNSTTKFEKFSGKTVEFFDGIIESAKDVWNFISNPLENSVYKAITDDSGLPKWELITNSIGSSLDTLKTKAEKTYTAISKITNSSGNRIYNFNLPFTPKSDI